MKIRVRDDRRIEHNGFSEFLSLADKKAFETDDLNFENRVKYQSHCNQQKLAYMRTNHWLDQSTRVLTASYCVVPFTQPSYKHKRTLLYLTMCQDVFVRCFILTGYN